MKSRQTGTAKKSGTSCNRLTLVGTVGSSAPHKHSLTPRSSMGESIRRAEVRKSYEATSLQQTPDTSRPPWGLPVTYILHNRKKTLGNELFHFCKPLGKLVDFFEHL